MGTPSRRSRAPEMMESCRLTIVPMSDATNGATIGLRLRVPPMTKLPTAASAKPALILSRFFSDRTPLTIVDVADGFFPLRVGDAVRFERIDERRFGELRGERL